MDPIALLAVATTAFVGTHFVSSTPLRGALAGAIGERGYLAVYSLAAFATLGWMIWAYGRAPVQPLWPGLRLVPAVLMPFALVFAACAIMSRSPTAIGQAGLLKAPDPARGIIRVTRHPLMWGIILWGAAHALARGDLASLLFFGGFVALAGLGTVLIDARKARGFGADWQRFAAVTSNLPFAAIAAGRNRFAFGEIGPKRIGVGLALYVALFLAHPYLFGARPY